MKAWMVLTMEGGVPIPTWKKACLLVDPCLLCAGDLRKGIHPRESAHKAPSASCRGVPCRCWWLRLGLAAGAPHSFMRWAWPGCPWPPVSEAAVPAWRYMQDCGGRSTRSCQVMLNFWSLHSHRTVRVAHPQPSRSPPSAADTSCHSSRCFCGGVASPVASGKAG